MSSAREQWGSRFGFILTTAGFSVGLGNIWRFPYIVGENGGGAFLILYLVIAFLIGVPLLTAEVALGRKAQLTAVGGMRRLTGSAGSPWNLYGWFGLVGMTLVMSFYVVIVGWIVGYLVMILSGNLVEPGTDYAARFSSFVAQPGAVLLYTHGFILTVGILAMRGLRGGVERVAVFVMPVLLLLLIGLGIRALTLPGAWAGVVWYLAPDFGALNGATIFAALGQAFFSVGVGVTVAFAFGSYLKPGASDVPGNAVIVVVFDTMVAILAGFMIFPALFAFGFAPDSGPGLLFVVMPALFETMPGGQWFGVVFFVLMLLAGLTTALAQFDVMARTMSDSLGWTRGKTSAITAAILMTTSTPMALSRGPFREVTVGGKNLFDAAEWTAANLLIPVGALLLILYVGHVWTFKGFQQDVNQGAGRFRVENWWRPLVVYLIPLAVGAILVVGLI
jgi:NSS family neurotransmitter:Na+ symporter